MLAQAFGGKGKEVKEPEDLAASMKEMLTDDNLWVLNVRIDPFAMKKAQSFSWLSNEDGDGAEGGDNKAKL